MVFPHPFGVELIPLKTDCIKLVAPFLGKTASFVGDALRVAPKAQFPFRHWRPVVLFPVELDQPLVHNLPWFQLGQDLFDAEPDIRQIAGSEERGCSFKSVGRWKIRESLPVARHHVVDRFTRQVIHEIQDDRLFPASGIQTAPQLLQGDNVRFGAPQEQDGIHSLDMQSFDQHIDGKEYV